LNDATGSAALEASLSRRFRVVETNVPIADRTLEILHPASAEDLIDEKDFDLDERLPYWAELWPSARVLGEWLLAKPSEGRSLLELGCGAGLVATCASLSGFDVTVSDYYEDALRFAEVNAWRNGGKISRGMLLDWRKLPPDLPRFDVVIASDVLYERPSGVLIAETLAHTLAPLGTAWVADPGRVAREAFIRALAPRALRVTDRTKRLFSDGTVQQTVTIFEIRHFD